jgi:hypothetical protein
MALLIWWWPSIITGATISLATIAAAQLIAQRTARAQDKKPAPPAGSATVVKVRSFRPRKLRLKEQDRRPYPTSDGPGGIKAPASSHITREMDL